MLSQLVHKPTCKYCSVKGPTPTWLLTTPNAHVVLSTPVLRKTHKINPTLTAPPASSTGCTTLQGRWSACTLLFRQEPRVASEDPQPHKAIRSSHQPAASSPALAAPDTPPPTPSAACLGWESGGEVKYARWCGHHLVHSASNKLPKVLRAAILKSTKKEHTACQVLKVAILRTGLVRIAPINNRIC